MKIGDKVVFLSEKGGGVIAGFQGPHVVLVEDEDGFQIPMNTKDVVVVSDNLDYSTTHVVKVKQQNTAPVIEEITTANNVSEFNPKPIERQGGDKLSVYLGFVPIDIHHLTSTTFEAYLVNDSNYFLSFSYIFAEGSRWSIRSIGVVEPNTKYFIEEFSHSQLVDLEKVAVQAIAYKKEKPFLLKSPINVEYRIDGVKFFKLHAFRSNLFFEQPALIYTLVENDFRSSDNDEFFKEKSKELQRHFDGNSSHEEAAKNFVKSGDKIRDNILVVDLHASALLDTTVGMSNADILQYQLKKFNEVMSSQISHRGLKIVFIHGKGEGVLRQAVIHELRYKYKSCPYQDASFQEYGYGATQVTIK